MSDGFVIDQPEQIHAFQLLALKGALKLQTLGMRHSRGSVIQAIRDITGLKERNAKKLLPLYEQWLRDNGYLK